MDTPKRYLGLLKSSLLHELYVENEARLFYLAYCLGGQHPVDWQKVTDPFGRMASFLDSIRKAKHAGLDWYTVTEQSPEGERHIDLRNVCDVAHSMIGRLRMDHLEWCLDRIREENIPGDLMETGICRGGAVIFMRGYLAAYAMKDRLVWAADSFAGVPPPRLEEDRGTDLSPARYPVLAVSLAQVQDIFTRYDLLDDRVRFLPGWFCDTLPAAPVKQLALLRLDGDLYESTMDALTALYHTVVPGGFVVVDDFDAVGGCRTAIERFREQHGLDEPLERIDQSSVFWRKRQECGSA